MFCCSTLATLSEVSKSSRLHIMSDVMVNPAFKPHSNKCNTDVPHCCSWTYSWLLWFRSLSLAFLVMHFLLSLLLLVSCCCMNCYLGIDCSCGFWQHHSVISERCGDFWVPKASSTPLMGRETCAPDYYASRQSQANSSKSNSDAVWSVVCAI